MRGSLATLLGEIVPLTGGIAWDDRGAITAIVPRSWAAEVAQMVARLVPELGDQLVLLWHQGLAYATLLYKENEPRLALQYRKKADIEVSEGFRLTRYVPEKSEKEESSSDFDQSAPPEKPGWDIVFRSAPAERRRIIRVPEAWGCGNLTSHTVEAVWGMDNDQPVVVNW
ncbi:MAG: hypothetical protein PHF98_04245 [Patescibacteria group bacterium]|nr:hypothetical protein [Patescibacteria group bacterium]